MRIGIFIFKGEPEATTQAFVAADFCLASIRRVMPGVHVTQLTDDKTPAIPGVDKVLRRPACPLSTLRTFWQSAVQGDWVFCDADVVFQKDVRPIFENADWQVAFAERQGGGVAWVEVGGRKVEMPYNVGISYSRSQEFWKDVHTRIKALPVLPGAGPRSQSDWFADQIEINDMVREGIWKVGSLPAGYNYAPELDESDRALVRDAAVVHYKGPRRKALLMKRTREEYWMHGPMEATSPALDMPPVPIDARANLGSVAVRGSTTAPVRVFIGYDKRQPLAYNVAAHSVVSRSTAPVSLTRLQLDQLPISVRSLTEFTFSRFLVPWLCGFEGWSIFLDADVLCRADITDLLRVAQKREDAAVHVVGHQGPRAFERASVMVFENERCKVLTPNYVEKNAKSLLGLGWAGDSVDLGLPTEWNHLVGYDPKRPDAKLVHFTMGVPCWPETHDSEYAAEWRAEWNALQATCSFDELMGKSVHVPHLRALS